MQQEQTVHAATAAIDNVVFPQIGYSGGIQEIYDSIRVKEPIITNDIQGVISELGTDLSGIQYSVKTGSSVQDKLVRETRKYPEVDVSEILAGMKDVIRYTEICNHDDIFTVAEDTIKALEDKGYKLSGISNYFANPYPSTQYMGLHLNFISPLGQEFELQVHSPESFDVKMRGHKLYEKIRVIVEDEKKAELIAKIVEIHQSIPKPPRFEELENYAMREEAKKNYINERKSHCSVICDHNIPTPDQIGHGMVYIVKLDGKVISEGYEAQYSDRSTEVCSHLVEKGIMETNGVFPDTSVAFSKTEEMEPGKTIIGHDTLDAGIALNHLLDSMSEVEMAHKEWMLTNVPVLAAREGYMVEPADGKVFTAKEMADFVKQLEALGAEKIEAVKVGKISAREAVPGEKVFSWKQDGTLETPNGVEAKEGEFVATRVDSNGEPVLDAAGHPNTWVMSKETFAKSYDIEHPEEGGIYTPVKSVRQFIKLDRTVEFESSYGVMKAEAGDYLHITDMNEIVPLGKNEFKETYEVVEPKAKESRETKEQDTER